MDCQRESSSDWAGFAGFRLRDNSPLRQQTLDLLQSLEQLLTSIESYLSAGSGHENLSTGATVSHLHTAKNRLHDDECKEESGMNDDKEPGDADSDKIDDGNDDSRLIKLQSHYELLVTIVQCLYRLAILFKDPAQHDFLACSLKRDAAEFERIDQQHMRDKFPQVSQRLVVSLGRANTRRRRYFIYRKRQSLKTKWASPVIADPTTDDPVPDDATWETADESGQTATSTTSESAASLFQTRYMDYEDSSAGSDFSQTSLVPSLAMREPSDIPAPPKNWAAGKLVQCPYCFCSIHIRNTRAWTRHVFTDLRPYSCPYEGCPWEERQHAERREWFAHIERSHDIADLRCPLCQTTQGSAKQLETHLARHLEELALFSLPRRSKGDDDDEVSGADNGPDNSGDNELALKRTVDGESSKDLLSNNIQVSFEDTAVL
ncbi:MAG: hypothetical protein LQ344_003975 [Seirophora lacunosa]|nr:MAG: hypothetical protein LQ344_003975 [Seirophora lacunosa]